MHLWSESHLFRSPWLHHHHHPPVIWGLRCPPHYMQSSCDDDDHNDDDADDFEKKNPSPHFTPINLPLSLSLLLRLHPLFSLYSVSFTSLRKERYLYYAEPSISSLTLSSDPLHVHLHTRLFTYTYTILPTNKQKQTPPAAIFSVLRHQSSQ